MKPRGFRQARCTGCGLTESGCVCALYPRLEAPLSISVVMTRSEARSASNSARLLALWLPGVELLVRGGPDDTDAPEELLDRPGSALLFPSGPRPEPLPSGVQHLIVPDGTWAQARRIERRCFAAAGLPRVSLAGPWPSVYGLRRAPQGLCTFEATALALGVLGHAPLAELLLERFAEWAGRARHLKAGGAPGATASAASGHPAAHLLRALPPGTNDASLANLQGADLQASDLQAPAGVAPQIHLAARNRE